MPNCKQVACILDFTMVLATNRLNTQFQHSIKAVKTEIMFDFEVVRFLEKNTNRRDFPHFPLKFDSLLYRPSLPRGSIFFCRKSSVKGLFCSLGSCFSVAMTWIRVYWCLWLPGDQLRDRGQSNSKRSSTPRHCRFAYTTGRHCKNDCTFPWLYCEFIVGMESHLNGVLVDAWWLGRFSFNAELYYSR